MATQENTKLQEIATKEDREEILRILTQGHPLVEKLLFLTFGKNGVNFAYQVLKIALIPEAESTQKEASKAIIRIDAPTENGQNELEVGTEEGSEYKGADHE